MLMTITIGATQISDELRPVSTRGDVGDGPTTLGVGRRARGIQEAFDRASMQAVSRHIAGTVKFRAVVKEDAYSIQGSISG